MEITTGGEGRSASGTAAVLAQRIRRAFQDRPPLGLLGFSFYWAWVLSLIIIRNQPFPADLPLAGMQMSAMLLLSRGVTLALIVAFLRLMPACRLIALAIPIALIVGPASTALLDVASTGSGLAAILASWALAGIADGFLLMGWLDLYRYVGIRNAAIAICLSSLLAVPLIIVARALTGPVATGFGAFLPLAGGLALREAVRGLSADARADAQTAPTIPSVRAFGYPRTVVAIAVYGLVLGAFQTAAAQEATASFPFDVRMVGIGAGALLALPLSLGDPATREALIYRVALPLVACGLLLAQLADSQPALVALLILAGFMLFDLLSTTVLLRLSALYELPPTAALGIGRMANTLGILTGQLAGHGLFGALSADQDLSALGSSALLLLIIIASGTLINPRRATAPEPGFDAPPLPPPTAQPDGTRTSGRWRRQCELIATRYGLSPRESEVLALLSRGRDAEYISTLFVISPHTAKTHIHNVYKKTDVHSQQALIDLVEDAEAELRD